MRLTTRRNQAFGAPKTVLFVGHDAYRAGAQIVVRHKGKHVFGELTWYPGAATGRFTPETYDQYWGDAIELPRRKVR